MTYKASIGSISHGTLRTQDLLRSFASELERLSTGAVPPIVAEARGFADMLDDSDMPLADDEEAAADCLLDLQENYLNGHAPDGCYFGAHAGDGSAFGFWPMDDFHA